MNYNIRYAGSEDADMIIDFQQKMAMETEGMKLDSQVISGGVRAVFEDTSKGRYYIADYNGKTIASLLITPEWSDWRNSYIWWFQSVYVVKEYRRKGVFKSMYEFVKQEAISNGIPGLRLYVEKDNSGAQKTYEALGMDGEHYRLFEWFE